MVVTEVFGSGCETYRCNGGAPHFQDTLQSSHDKRGRLISGVGTPGKVTGSTGEDYSADAGMPKHTTVQSFQV